MILLDGAMGTQLQARGLQAGKDPADWNLENAAAVIAVHRAYLDAGSNIILTNTFGANRLKYHGAHALGEIVDAALANAAEAIAQSGVSDARIALDLGPTGRMLKPAGDLDFDTAYAAFAETVRLANAAAHRPDLVFIETMGDTREIKAALLAARENCSLPVYVTVALGEDGKLLTGADAECLAALFSALKPDAVGFNCGMGPRELRPHVERLASLVDLPIIVKANAGMPRVRNGETVFDVGPEEFAHELADCVSAGATILGGCCGTTPEHIAAVRAAIGDVTAGAVRRVCHAPRCVISSGNRVVELPLEDTIVIGERINPTGKKKLKEAYRSGDTGYILREAVAQVEAGASVLDVNAGVPGIDEVEVLGATVEAIQGVTNVPLQLDTANGAALERALRLYNGKALVNSVNGSEESLSTVLPLVAKYGGAVVALTLDEQGIPPTVEGRLAIAKRIIERGTQYGLTKDDFLVDVLCLAVSAQPDSARVILDSIRAVRHELGCRTVLGVSNISFGLPARALLNSSFYTLAMGAGLTAAIVNPLAPEMMNAHRAYRALLGHDVACGEWIATATTATVAPALPAGAVGLRAAIVHGLTNDAALAAAQLLGEGRTAIDLIDGEIVPALEEVGAGFEQGKLFLPQLLMAAESASAAFGEVKRHLGANGEASQSQGRIVLATVKGDIHDIGKNIVRALLENYGFEVIDLGRDVAPERVVEAALANRCRLVGLSALMTTTVGAMAETIVRLREADPSICTFVGGAVVTAEFAREIGATYYTRDAMASVRLAKEFFHS